MASPSPQRNGPSSNASASASASFTSSNGRVEHDSDEAIERRLQRRLSALSEPSGVRKPVIHVTLPPPREDELEARLKALQSPALPTVDEAELARRFNRLHGQAEDAPVDQPSLYSKADISMAGHGEGE